MANTLYDKKHIDSRCRRSIRQHSSLPNHMYFHSFSHMQRASDSLGKHHRFFYNRTAYSCIAQHHLSSYGCGFLWRLHHILNIFSPGFSNAAERTTACFFDIHYDFSNNFDSIRFFRNFPF